MVHCYRSHGGERFSSGCCTVKYVRVAVRTPTPPSLLWMLLGPLFLRLRTTCTYVGVLTMSSHRTGGVALKFATLVWWPWLVRECAPWRP